MLRTLIILSIAFSLSACRSGSNTASTAPADSTANVLAGWTIPEKKAQALPEPEESAKKVVASPPAEQQVVQEQPPAQPVKQPASKEQPMYTAQPESRPEPADPVRYQSVTLEWTIPMQRENGQLLGANELDGFIIEYTQKGKPGLVEQEYVEGGQQASKALELPPGYYSFRVIAVDTQGLTSNPSEWVGITLS
jgi:hypothetical protein